MSIPVACSCGREFAAGDSLAGKRVKCPTCQQPITVPAGDHAASPTAPVSSSAKSAQHRRAEDGDSNVTVGVRCSCGKTVKAGQKLLGKRVKCPGCGQPLAIPAAASKPSMSPQTPSSTKTAAKQSARQPPHSAEAATVMGALFDEIGFGTSIAKKRCPSCKFDIDPEAVLCVKCGYHLETGKRLRTKVIKRKRI